MKQNLIKLLYICSIFPNSICFDWEFYLKNNNIKFIKEPLHAFYHFMDFNINKNIKTVPIQIENTNFDWEYYISCNNLHHIKSQKEAILHYQKIGRQKNLLYCKSFNLVILFHLHNLELIDEFIDKINNFMRINPYNQYYIKINIPVDKNINSFKTVLTLDYDLNNLKNKILDQTPYHKHLIDNNNIILLGKIDQYLNNKLQIPKERIQIIFSENRGMDIGGTFLLFDQLKKSSINFDFIVKIHTKSRRTEWRYMLLSFLNIKINKVLRQYECIYSIKYPYNHNLNHPTNISLDRLFDYFKLKPKHHFDFCAGTMFIVSNKFFNYIKHWDFIDLYARFLKFGKPITGYEQAFERLFGYIFEVLNLKTLNLEYYKYDPQTEIYK